MNHLQQFAQPSSEWSLGQLVQITNQLLPQFLSQQESSQRLQADINPRLVRHYTTTGLIDKPLKEGREAYYTYRHLLQLLVVRRLQWDGYNSASVQKLTLGKSNQDLEALLQGGMQLTVEAANPALAFLQKVQTRQGNAMPSAVQRLCASHKETDHDVSSVFQDLDLPQWNRMEVLPGLEIHIREDFAYPASEQERHNLLELMGQYLFKFAAKRRHRP